MENLARRVINHMRFKMILGMAGASMAVQGFLKGFPQLDPLFSILIGCLLFGWAAKGD